MFARRRKNVSFTAFTFFEDSKQNRQRESIKTVRYFSDYRLVIFIFTHIQSAFHSAVLMKRFSKSLVNVKELLFTFFVFFFQDFSAWREVQFFAMQCIRLYPMKSVNCNPRSLVVVSQYYIMPHFTCVIEGAKLYGKSTPEVVENCSNYDHHTWKVRVH